MDDSEKTIIITNPQKFRKKTRSSYFPDESDASCGSAILSQNIKRQPCLSSDADANQPGYILPELTAERDNTHRQNFSLQPSTPLRSGAQEESKRLGKRNPTPSTEPIFYGAIKFPQVQSVLWDRTPQAPPTFISPELILPIMVIPPRPLRHLSVQLMQANQTPNLWLNFTFSGSLRGITELDDELSSLLPPPVVQETVFALVLDTIDCKNTKTSDSKQNAWASLWNQQTEDNSLMQRCGFNAKVLATLGQGQTGDPSGLTSSETSQVLDQIMEKASDPLTSSLSCEDFCPVTITAVSHPARKDHLMKHEIMSLKAEAIVPNLTFRFSRIFPLPILNTALHVAVCQGLSGDSGQQTTGYLTLNETRKLVLMLESDAFAFESPLVGIWISCVGSDWAHASRHLQVWGACLRYFLSSDLNQQDRQRTVCIEPQTFLLVWFPEKGSGGSADLPWCFEVTAFPNGQSGQEEVEVRFSHFDYTAKVSLRPDAFNKAIGEVEDAVVGRFRKALNSQPQKSFLNPQAFTQQGDFLQYEDATPVPQPIPTPISPLKRKTQTLVATVQDGIKDKTSTSIVGFGHLDNLNLPESNQLDCINIQQCRSPEANRSESPCDEERQCHPLPLNPQMQGIDSGPVSADPDPGHRMPNGARWSWSPSPSLFRDNHAQQLIAAQQEQLHLMQRQLGRLQAQLSRYQEQERIRDAHHVNDQPRTPLQDIGTNTSFVLQKRDQQTQPSQSSGDNKKVNRSEDERSKDGQENFMDNSWQSQSVSQTIGTNTSFLLPQDDHAMPPDTEKMIHSQGGKTKNEQSHFLNGSDQTKEEIRREPSESHQNSMSMNSSGNIAKRAIREHEFDNDGAFLVDQDALRARHLDQESEVPTNHPYLETSSDENVLENCLERRNTNAVLQQSTSTEIFDDAHVNYIRASVNEDASLPRIQYSLSDLDDDDAEEEPESLQHIEAKYLTMMKSSRDRVQRPIPSSHREALDSHRDVKQKMKERNQDEEGDDDDGAWKDNFLDSSIKRQSHLIIKTL